MVVHPLWRPFAPYANAARQSERVAYRQADPGPLELRLTAWDAEYTDVSRLIVAAISDQALRLSHVGSTAVPGLLAKPIVDLDLIVVDVEDEDAYVPPLELVGFRLIFRDDLAGDAHRQLSFEYPNANVHVWSPRAVEPERHELLNRHLQRHEAARERYAQAKRVAAEGDGSSTYNDLKAAVIYDIYEQAFLTDPSHHHDPQPRQPPL